MKVSAVLFLLLFLISCTHRPAFRKGHPVAYDSIADGKVRASAVKILGASEVCFDITINVKGTEQRTAEPSNWSLAWIDGNSRYHLMSLIQRDPAAAPQGTQNEWTNTFRTCGAISNLNEVKSLILTPKELPYEDTQGLKLKWK